MYYSKQKTFRISGYYEGQKSIQLMKSNFINVRFILQYNNVHETAQRN